MKTLKGDYFSGVLVRLIAIEREDIPLLAKWMNTESLTLASGARFPVSLHEQDQWYDRMQADQSKKKLLIQLHTGEKIGQVSLHGIDNKNRNAIIGVHVDPAYHRMGYAREAINLLMRYAFDELGLHKLYAEIFATNQPSLSLFTSLGFCEEFRKKEHIFSVGVYIDLIVFSIYGIHAF